MSQNPSQNTQRQLPKPISSPVDWWQRLSFSVQWHSTQETADLIETGSNAVEIDDSESTANSGPGIATTTAVKKS